MLVKRLLKIFRDRYTTWRRNQVTGKLVLENIRTLNILYTQSLNGRLYEMSDLQKKEMNILFDYLLIRSKDGL